jgi:hypothetical protein
MPQITVQQKLQRALRKQPMLVQGIYKMSFTAGKNYYHQHEQSEAKNPTF